MNDKSPSKIDSLKDNKKLRIFLLFLSLSFLFWVLIKLSKSYISDVEFRVVYTEEPQNKLLLNASGETIKLTVKTIGFKLLKYNLRKNEISYSLSDLQNKKDSEYYSVTKSKINYIQAQFSAETEVLKIKPDTLFVNLDVKKSKKVRVATHIDMEFKPGYNLINKIVVQPEFITISGHSKVIDSIDEVKTEFLELSSVSKSFAQKIKLVLPNEFVSLSADEVSVKGEVEKITEGSFLIPFEIINVPKKYLITTYPKKIKIVYQVPLKDYNKISQNSFKVRCDYRESQKNNLDYLIPKLVEKPELLYDVKIFPNKIEYLIKK